MLPVVFLAVLATVIVSAFAADCDEPASNPPIVLTLIPYMPAQVGPTSTVWGRIETAYYPVVDCGNGISVTNVLNNPEPTGPFTTRTTVDVLTITRVECMATESVVTRRDDLQEVAPKTAEPYMAVVQGHKAKRSVDDTVAQLASPPIVPNSNQLTVQQERWITQCNTAIFCVDLINTGMSLNDTCTYLRDVNNSYLLENASIDPIQAADIICWAAVNGFDLNTSVFNLVSALEALEYAVQVASNYTTNTTDLCNSLDYTAADDLGIDAAGIEAFVCNGSTSTVVPSFITAGTSGTGLPGTAPTTGPYANSTITPHGTAVSGTAAASDTMSLSFPNATYGMGTGTGNLPATAVPYQYGAPPFPATVTSESSSAVVRKWF